jgi:DNA-binding response OmpR family regulator
MIGRKKILLIDDEKNFCFFAKKNLEATGEFVVLCANDPLEGIRFAKRESPDLILLDINMPRKDGFEVLEAIKKNEKTLSIPVIMLTAVEGDDAKIKSSGLYSEDYIVKPISYEKLREKIDTVLARWSAWRR